jgi:hypothetical protein
VLVQQHERRRWIDRDVVAAGPVVVAVESVRPRVKEWDAHERPFFGVGAHAGALPQQLLTAVNERRPEHSRARHPRGVNVGRVVVKY